MAVLTFTHPLVDESVDSNGGKLGPLIIETGANEISWGYGLNTQKYPTFGGEVVQILSVYVDDLTIDGEVVSYAMMERIYTWFVRYIQFASQGFADQAYNQIPVAMQYAEMGLALQIVPKSLPSLLYGRDVVAPRWSLQAHVMDASDVNILQGYVIDKLNNTPEGIDITQFGRITGDVGFVEENPFSNPVPSDTQSVTDITTQRLGDLADYYSNIISAYQSGDFDALLADSSVPARGADTSGSTAQQHTTGRSP